MTHARTARIYMRCASIAPVWARLRHTSIAGKPCGVRMGLCSIQLGDSSLQEGTIAVKPDTYAGSPCWRLCASGQAPLQGHRTLATRWQFYSSVVLHACTNLKTCSGSKNMHEDRYAKAMLIPFLCLHAQGSGYSRCQVMIEHYLCVHPEDSERCLPLRNM